MAEDEILHLKTGIFKLAQIKDEFEHYEIGEKPGQPDSITANYSEGRLTVNVIKNGKTLRLSSNVVLQDGGGPFTAIIGMAFFPGAGGTGSLPADIFTSPCKIASFEFEHDQVTTYGSQKTSDSYYQLYTELNITNTGQYSACALSISCLNDGLELVQDSLAIDLKHLAVTSCSYAGEIALFAGAFDEQIALTVDQESSEGGAPVWRVSETLGNMERFRSENHKT